MALLVIMRPILEDMSIKHFPTSPRQASVSNLLLCPSDEHTKINAHNVRSDIYLPLPQDKIVNP